MVRFGSYFLLALSVAASVVWAQNGSANRASGVRVGSLTRPINIPIEFEENQGQAPKEVNFVATGTSYRAELSGSLIAIRTPLRAAMGQSPAKRVPGPELRISISGIDPRARGTPEGKLPGYSNYFFGSDPAKWITHADHYTKVRYRNVYPGIDLIFHGDGNALEEDFLVRQGADPKRIGFNFGGNGFRDAAVDKSGDLVLRVDDGELRLRKPRAFQLVTGREVPVQVSYEVRGRSAKLHLGHYDVYRDLVVDPVLVYSTFFGGTPVTSGNYTGAYQDVTGMAVDSTGLYLAGMTTSAEFPVTSAVVQPVPPAGIPANTEGFSYFVFVSKFDPTGQLLLFSTYIAGLQYPPALSVDGSGNIFVAALAAPGLPIPTGSQPLQGTAKGQQNLGIVKLNSSGTAILAATYLGGSQTEGLGGISVGPTGNLFIAGSTTSNDFPLKNPLQGALGSGGYSGFVAQIDSGLTDFVYSTYVGGNSSTRIGDSISPHSMAVDSMGDVVVVGTATAGFPVTQNAYEPTCPNMGVSAATCPVVITLKPDGSALLYATYLGGLTDSVNAVVVDASGNMYVAGTTGSANFPVVSPVQSCAAINAGNGIPSENFVSELDATGALVFSTCLGPNPANPAYSAAIYPYFPLLAVDGAGNVYMTASSGAGLPLQNAIDANAPGTPASQYQAPARLFVSEIAGNSHTLAFSSFIAGPFSLAGGSPAGTGDGALAIAVDSAGGVYVGGASYAGSGIATGYSNFPVFNAMQSYFVKGDNTCLADASCPFVDGFVMKISPAAGAAAALVPAEIEFPPTLVGTTTAAQGTIVYDLGTDPLTVSNTTISGDFAVQSNNCATVSASGGSCTIQITFTPTALGTRNGTLSITDSSAGSPHIVALTGEGATADLLPSPTSLTFANQTAGTTSQAQVVTLTAGVAAIQSLSIQTTGDFVETNSCGSSVAALATCQLQVTFTPTASGTRTGSITITDSAPNSPQTITLTGTGTESLGLGVASGSANSATVTAGASANYALVIGGQGLGGMASLSCTGAPTDATCSVPPTESIAASNSLSFSVSITTTARSSVTRYREIRPMPIVWLMLATLAFMLMLKRGQALRFVRVCFCLALFLVFASCGGGGNGQSSSGTPAGNYQLTVTGQIGNTSQSVTLNLTVK